MSESFDEWYKDQKEFQKEWAEQELGIVRCKDCKYWKKRTFNKAVGKDEVYWICVNGNYGMSADDFCSRGERK